MLASSPPRVTLLDIASDAGVSRATVSLVLRNVPSVAPATRKRVLQSINRLRYVYHRGAASLRSQRSHAIGLIVSDITNPFFAEIIVAIEDWLGSAGLVTILGNTSENLAKQQRLLRSMSEYPADGILICPTQGSEKTGLPTGGRLPPIVAFTRPMDGVDYAGTDNVTGSELAVEHLVGLGHRRIAFIGGPAQLTSAQQRFSGYRRGLEKHALEYRKELFVEQLPTRQGGYHALISALQLSPAPTAAVCFNDVVAFGAIEALRGRGKEPGRDFSIVGFNNIADARAGSLTTIDTSPAKLGETAADLLLNRIRDPGSPLRQVILSPRLVVRESTGKLQHDSNESNQ
ncbi:MAG: LacI family DNA-binding transcriptional regulator [Verrucomicrobia bacterium]|nr:LacI family DNA-binding transcriptional regulator [Verrucomicrobiota bacterium]